MNSDSKCSEERGFVLILLFYLNKWSVIVKRVKARAKEGLHTDTRAMFADLEHGGIVLRKIKTSSKTKSWVTYSKLYLIN